MCHSQAEGGQRCHGHALTALTNAQTRYGTLIHEARTLMTAGKPPTTEFTTKGLQARFELDDALARYASTPQGETNLIARMDALMTLGRQPTSQPANAQYHAYANAITEGRRLRASSKEIHAAVRNGTIATDDATRLSQYPSERTQQDRAEQVAAAASWTPTTPPATRPSKPTRNGYTNIGPKLASTDTLPCALCGYRPVAWIQKIKTPTGQIKYSRTCNDC